MSTRKFTMPNTPIIGTVLPDGGVQLNPGYQAFFAGIEDISKRVALHIDPATATVSDIVTAMINADQMKPE